MICFACRTAGEYNQKALDWPTEALWHAAAAVEWHDTCHGGCDCQHRVGRWSL